MKSNSFELTGESRHPTLFVDLHQKQIDKDAMKRADELRTEILPRYLEKTNCFNYEVDWLGMSGQNMEAYDNYIMSLVVDVYKVKIILSATTQ